MHEWASELASLYGSDAIEWIDGYAVIADDTETPALVARVRDDLPLNEIEDEIAAIKAKLTDDEPHHGAILTKHLSYVFTPASNTDYEYEVTHSALPPIEPSGEPPRPFDSIDELMVCFHRALRLTRPPGAATIDERKTALLEVIRALHTELLGETPEGAFGEAVAGIFNGFDLAATEHRIKQAFTRRVAESDSLLRYSTRGEIAEFMVQLANISPGETVVDPAAGLGIILRAAATATTNIHGIEIDGDIADAARFFNDLLDITAPITTEDAVEGTHPVDRAEIDHIFLEPPSTRRVTDDTPVESLVTREGVHIEETLLRAATESLPPDGTLTAFIPFAILDRPDPHSRDLRASIREGFRITALIELTNQAYYPYPGVRTAVIQLEPYAGTDYDIPVAVLDAAAPAARFGTSGDAPIDPLLDETLEAITTGNAETIPVDAFGETLAPSSILRHREMETTLRSEYTELVPLGDAASIARGEAIPWRDLGTEGVPFLRVAAVTGHASADGTIPPDDVDVVATPSDLLISVTGTIGRLYRPDSPCVPGDDWAVVRFDSPDQARVYEAFFHTTTGTKLLELLKRDAIAPYPRYTPRLPLRRLRRVPVPAFAPDEITAIATALRSLTAPSTADRDTVFKTRGTSSG